MKYISPEKIIHFYPELNNTDTFLLPNPFF